MMWSRAQAYVAQTLNQRDVGLNGLPAKFDGGNIQKGLIIAFGIAGGIALIVVAYGGLRYVLSQGNPQETNKAKNTIVDGMIGLAIIVSAGSIIGFVVSALR